MYKTIGILTGGGDAPGLNAVIRSVVTTASGQYGMKVIGIEDGFEGLLGETHTRILEPPTLEVYSRAVELFWARAIAEGLSRSPGKVFRSNRRLFIRKRSTI